MREKRKCWFKRSLPTGVHQLCICLRSHLSVFFFPQMWHCVFVAWIQLSGWCVKSLTASLRACAHGETAASTQRREEDRDVGQAGFTAGVHVSSAVSKWEGWDNTGQLLSHLMSTHFSHQLSIYRLILHSFPSMHAYLKGCMWLPKQSHNKLNCQPSFNLTCEEHSVLPKQIRSRTPATFRWTSTAWVMKTCAQMRVASHQTH